MRTEILVKQHECHDTMNVTYLAHSKCSVKLGCWYHKCVPSSVLDPGDMKTVVIFKFAVTSVKVTSTLMMNGDK